MSTTKNNCLVKTLPPELTETLRAVLEKRGWEFSALPYAHFKASRDKTNVVLYESGKLVVQGGGASDFNEFILEPEVLGSAAFREMEESAAVAFTPHAGMDESGKGDFFGPLVVCAVYLDKPLEQKLAEFGVCDCKLIKSDKRLLEIARKSVAVLKDSYGIVAVGPEAYNRMYASFGNLNRLLAWCHARALENLLEKRPECKMAIADKFGDEHLILNALQEKGRGVELIQRTKAESDMAVAAASVLARAGFLKKLGELSEKAEIPLPKGAGELVDRTASALVRKGGRELLSQFAKMHFRTAEKALGLP